MTRTQAIFAGALTGMAALVALAWVTWYYLFAEDGPLDFSREWSVSSLVMDAEHTMQINDVWQLPESLLIEPQNVQRVEWRDRVLLGRDPWGYFLYYRARVKDTVLSRHLRERATDEVKPLPVWATYRPTWWNPQKSIPAGRLTEQDLQSDDVFIETVGTEVFLYWVRAPYEGYIQTGSESPGW